MHVTFHPSELFDLSGASTPHATCVDTCEGVGYAMVAVAGVAGGVAVLDLETGALISKIAR
jgi:hypothetical protein